MSKTFAGTLRKLRTEKGLSQQDLANQMYVTRSTIARWENGSRLPNAMMISRLAECLCIDFNTLLNDAVENEEVQPLEQNQ